MTARTPRFPLLFIRCSILVVGLFLLLAAKAVAAPVGGPVPPKTSATSVTFVSTQTAFVLGTAPCPHKPCSAILHTTNRGSSWVGLPAPLEGVSYPGGPGLWGLRFADPNHGYAFGDGLWQTSNGAASWTHATAPGRLVDTLEAVQDRELVAVTSSCGPTSMNCTNSLSLYHRPIIGGSWQRILTVGPPGAYGAYIDVHHNVVWVLMAGKLFVSTDGGLTFKSHGVPCNVHATGNTFGSPDSIADDGSHTYLLCTGEAAAGHTIKTVYRTTGTSSGWTQTGQPPTGGDGGTLAAGSDQAIVIASSSGASMLYRSTDGGHDWNSPLSYGDGGLGWADLGFTTATDGVVIHGPANTDGGSADFPGQLLLTDDGGHTWHAVSF